MEPWIHLCILMFLYCVETRHLIYVVILTHFLQLVPEVSLTKQEQTQGGCTEQAEMKDELKQVLTRIKMCA